MTRSSLSRQSGRGIPGDQALFVGGDHQDGGARRPADDSPVLDSVFPVQGVVEFQAEVAEAAYRTLADSVGVLADSAGEHEGIEATQGHEHACDLAGQSVGEDLQREFRILIAAFRSALEFSHVTRNPGNPEKAAFTIQELLDAREVQTKPVGEKTVEARIDVS